MNKGQGSHLPLKVLAELLTEAVDAGPVQLLVQGVCGSVWRRTEGYCNLAKGYPCLFQFLPWGTSEHTERPLLDSLPQRPQEPSTDVHQVTAQRTCWPLASPRSFSPKGPTSRESAQGLFPYCHFCCKPLRLSNHTSSDSAPKMPP